MSSTLKATLFNVLEPVGQTHLLRFWDELSEESQQKLAQQIQAIDWPQVMEWTRTAGTGLGADELSGLKPAPYVPRTPRTPEETRRHEEARRRGEELLRAGKVAAFTVAGGQGTRLGYAGPKGTYPVTAVRSKSLFQLFAEGILRAQKQYGTQINWYIMTSVINHDATCSFFSEHNYFGLNPEQVTFFSQGMLPAFDLQTGKALLESKDSLALSPNGHGGSFMALRESGALADMKAKGITTLTYWQVDNPMVKPFDPLFIGLHDISGSDMSSKALIKRNAAEKLGHFCILDGKTIIIEYSDMPDELLNLTDGEGRLAFRAGSPAIHVLSIAFIEKLTAGKLDFKPHRAKKKVPFVNDNGESIAPESPNALKLEFFLFDALPVANSPLILEGSREDEFAPVKNPSGEDSPDSCRAALLAQAARWFEEAGRPLPRKADGTLDALVELSPATFAGPDDIRRFSDKMPSVAPGEIAYFEFP